MRSIVTLLALAALVAGVSAAFHFPMSRTKGGHLGDRWMKRRGADNFADYNMSGNVYPQGIYWVTIELGTPRQYFQVAVDTGSTDLLVPQAGCKGCHPNITGTYDPSASSTESIVPCDSTLRCRKPCSSQCEFVNTYETCNLTDPTQPCTVTGVLYYDAFAMNTYTAPQVYFGAIQTQTSNFEQFFYIDGVMGLAYDGASAFNGVSAFQKLVDNKQCDNMFAICMTPTGGVLTLGGTNSSLYTGDFKYSKVLPLFGRDYAYFQSNLDSISVGGQKTSAPGVVAVVDSGTNVLLLNSKLFTPVQDAIQQQMCKGGSGPAPPGVCSGSSIFTGTCYQYTSSQIDQFPAMELDLDGVSLSMPATSYIVNNGTAGWYCLGIKNQGKFGQTIIGDTTMMQYYVLFDVANRRIGWAPVNAANCASGQ